MVKKGIEVIDLNFSIKINHSAKNIGKALYLNPKDLKKYHKDLRLHILNSETITGILVSLLSSGKYSKEFIMFILTKGIVASLYP